VLVASTGGAGHFGPLVPVIEALAERGDELLLVVPPELEARAASLGQPFSVGDAPPAEELAAIHTRLATGSRREAAIAGNRDLFGRLWTAALLPAAERACRDWGPELVVHEAAEYASAVAADKSGIPHAQVAISLAQVEASSLDLAAAVLARHGDGFVDRLRASPYLSRFPASLDPSPFPRTRRYADASANVEPLPGWWRESDAPLVYITFGSVLGDLPDAVAAYRAVLDAVADLPARVLFTIGRAIEPDALGAPPPHVHIEAWVPQEQVLPAADVVVAHGGSGTTFGALAAGVPLVLVPFFADQPVNSDRVAATGAAIVVASDADPHSTRPDPLRLRAAIESVLGDTSYRRAASRIAAEMRALPSVEEVVDALASHPRRT